MLSFSISQNHPSFPGHFPGNPILPGVLLLELVMSYAQLHIKDVTENYTLLNVKFLASVSPGDELSLTFSETSANCFKFAVYVANGKLGIQDALACSGQLRKMVD